MLNNAFAFRVLCLAVMSYGSRGAGGAGVAPPGVDAGVIRGGGECF